MHHLPHIIKSKSSQNLLLLLFFAFLLCIREPFVFIDGRFWNEEGTIFFHNAWVSSPLQALFFSYGGYLNLPVNAATLIAKWIVPLEYAPYVTTFLGLFFQLVPIYLLLTAKDEWLQPFKTRLFATLLLLLVPESIEISTQSLHIQFQLMLASCIILILKNNKGYQQYIRLGILLLSTLSGTMPIILFPFYIIKTYIEKNNLRAIQCITLFIGYLIQYVFFYETYRDRAFHISIDDFLSIFYMRDLVLPLVGDHYFIQVYLSHFATSIDRGHHFFVIPSIISLVFIITTILTISINSKLRPALFLFIPALTILAFSIFGSLGSNSLFFMFLMNGRYLFISQALLCLTLLYITCHIDNKMKIIGYIIIVWLIIIGSRGFYQFTQYSYNPPNLAPPWRKQVKLWKENNNYKFEIWLNWKMTLPSNIKQ